jgi:hypothetical protein
LHNTGHKLDYWSQSHFYVVFRLYWKHVRWFSFTFLYRVLTGLFMCSPTNVSGSLKWYTLCLLQILLSQCKPTLQNYASFQLI